MSRFGKLVVAGFLGTVAAGCGGDNAGPSLPNLVGTWHATKIQVTNKANASETIDVTPLGATLEFIARADHTFTATFGIPGEPPDVSNGTYVQTATMVTTTDDASSGGQVNVFTYSLSGGTLTMSGGTVDFNFGSGDVASRLDLTLVH